MNSLFGTDGIRGKADAFPLDSKTVSIIGRALAEFYAGDMNRAPRFIVGRDTRESGPRIESAFAAGAQNGGAECESAGVITTPGVAYITKAMGFDAGVVISASHNPYEDNGLKVFLPTGQKLPREVEELIEREIHEGDVKDVEAGLVADSMAESFRQKYLTHFNEDFGGLDLTSKKVVCDCANGAASDLAPKLFRSLGAETIAINNEPDGQNINRNCGSLHLEALQAEVVKQKADIGIAFDGDADRSLFVDENGKIVDGDGTLWIMANYLMSSGGLTKNTVVATVMSNIGLEIALNKLSVDLRRTAVGDKYVLRELIESKLSVGGEQSGHIIFPSRSLVGDGMQTALFLLDAMSKSGATLSELTRGFEAFPQILINVRVSSKPPFDDVEEIASEASRIGHELGDEGRLLLRYSGTENLARVMIEGADQRDIEEKANRLASIIEDALGE